MFLCLLEVAEISIPVKGKGRDQMLKTFKVLYLQVKMVPQET